MVAPTPAPCLPPRHEVMPARAALPNMQHPPCPRPSPFPPLEQGPVACWLLQRLPEYCEAARNSHGHGHGGQSQGHGQGQGQGPAAGIPSLILGQLRWWVGGCSGGKVGEGGQGDQGRWQRAMHALAIRRRP